MIFATLTHWSSCDLNAIFTFIVSAARLCRTLLFLCLNKLSLLSWLNKRNKQTDREGQHSFILYNFVYTVCGGPCHLYRLQTAFWDLFLPLRTACLFSYGEKKHFRMFVLFPHWYCKYSNIFCSQKHRKTFLLWFFFHFQILSTFCQRYCKRRLLFSALNYHSYWMWTFPSLLLEAARWVTLNVGEHIQWHSYCYSSQTTPHNEPYKDIVNKQ